MTDSTENEIQLQLTYPSAYDIYYILSLQFEGFNMVNHQSLRFGDGLIGELTNTTNK